MLAQVSNFRLLKVQLCLYDLAKTKGLSWVWRLMPVIPALRKLRQEDLDFEAGLGCLVRLSQNNDNNGLETDLIF